MPHWAVAFLFYALFFMKVIITGTTGMVGEGLLLACLQQPAVTHVLGVSRRPSGHRHPKLSELLHADFFDWTGTQAQLSGYDACFFGLGMSSVGVPQEVYHRSTYTLTMAFAEALQRHSPALAFCYVSGAGTRADGRMAWARTKAKTENDLRALLPNAYGFRPGFLVPMPGQRHTLSYYRYLKFLVPVLQVVTPGLICSLKQMALAMVAVSGQGYEKPVLEVSDIKAAACKIQ